MSTDEVSLSKGELYTFVTNKAGKGKKGTIVACVAGTKAEDIQAVLAKISEAERDKVEEVTLDMAKNMESGVKTMFPNAQLVTDRFHVVQLALDALQHVRIKARWAEMDKENEGLAAIKAAKKELDSALKTETDLEQKTKLNTEYTAKIAEYQPIEFKNGDSPKQLLARSRYILAKKRRPMDGKSKRACYNFIRELS